MYIPKEFTFKDQQSMVDFVRQNSFGILFSSAAGEGHSATHVPFLLEVCQEDEGKLRLLTHVARANPHWRSLDGEEVLVAFSGPHAYITPDWYVESQAVPTWNYVAVHACGKARLIQDGTELHGILRRMVEFYDKDSKLLHHLEEDFYQKMARGVVGVEIEVAKLEGKAKLSQNKSPESIQGVLSGLEARTDRGSQELLAFMRSFGVGG